MTQNQLFFQDNLGLEDKILGSLSGIVMEAIDCVRAEQVCITFFTFSEASSSRFEWCSCVPYRSPLSFVWLASPTVTRRVMSRVTRASLSLTHPPTYEKGPREGIDGGNLPGVRVRDRRDPFFESHSPEWSKKLANSGLEVGLTKMRLLEKGWKLLAISPEVGLDWVINK